MTDKFQWTEMRSPNTPLFFKRYIKNRKKTAFVIVLFPIQNSPDGGLHSFRKKWDLL